MVSELRALFENSERDTCARGWREVTGNRFILASSDRYSERGDDQAF